MVVMNPVYIVTRVGNMLLDRKVFSVVSSFLFSSARHWTPVYTDA